MEEIIKRDGRKVKFDISKIAGAIDKALKAANIVDTSRASVLAQQVVDKFPADSVPTVEEVQDQVEAVLIENGLVLTAKEYILYRANRTRIRESNTRLFRALRPRPMRPAGL